MTRRDLLKIFAHTSLLAAVGNLAIGAPPSSMTAPAQPLNGTPTVPGPFLLPKLDYTYDALEPYISAQIMELHYTRHHVTYLKNLNEALAGDAKLSQMSIENILENLSTIPEAIRTTIRNNGGGHFNHSFFWKNLTPKVKALPQGELTTAIDKTFGSFSRFQDAFAKAALSVFGSGWAWLIVDKKGVLSITTTANQDSPLSLGQYPVLGLDVWEHAYYLQYFNKRADYIQAWWNVVDWSFSQDQFTRIFKA